MKRILAVMVAATAIFLLVFSGRWADEGMWLLDSIHSLPLASMQRHGLALTPEQMYSTTQTSLKDAIVLLGGGTGSFISRDGLMVTNHHVAYEGLQALSSVQEDYLKNGFLAATHDEELQTTYTAQIVKEMRDVTEQVLAGIPDTVLPDIRNSLIKKKSSEIEEAAKDSSDVTCRVIEMYSGVKYYLFVYQVLRDVRLVYAPPSAIGNYGGEVDNWMWPRHTGDFALMRAYVAPNGSPAPYARTNVPFHPKTFLPISTGGLADSSFAMIMGYPGRTYRYREAAGTAVLRDETLPITIDLYKTRMDVIDTYSSKDRAVEIAYANRVRGLANTYKNFLGVLQGMKRADLLTLKENQERLFRAHIDSSAVLKKNYGTVLDDLAKADAEVRSYARKLSYVSNLTSGVDIFRIADRMERFASIAEPTEQDRDMARASFQSVFKNSNLTVDKETLIALLLKGFELPAAQQPQFFTARFGRVADKERGKAVRSFVEDLYDNSDLGTMEGCEKLLHKSPAKILRDDGVQFEIAVGKDQSDVLQQNGALTTRVTRLRGRFIEALLEWKHGTATYPDANRTLRFTYGQVMPYSPRDAVHYDAFTTLTGVMEKETGVDPFIVPPRLRTLWEKKDFGRYADARLHDVPVAFICDLDITGGNSGSPVINGKGELIGCAFDGDWEAVVGDYYFQESLNRTISVDSRYILFILDKFSDAKNIMAELTIH